jgi:hypothetical protein
MRTIVKVGTGLAWGALAMANITLLFGLQFIPLLLQFLLLGLLLIVLFWLLLRYNRSLAQWRAVAGSWILYSLFRWLSVGLRSISMPFVRENLVSSAMTLAVEMMLVGYFTLLILVIRRDASLVYMVVFFALGGPLLRGLVINAGGVLDFFFGQTSAEPLSQFSTSETLVMALPCMSSLGVVAFVPHLLWLLLRELRGD